MIKVFPQVLALLSLVSIPDLVVAEDNAVWLSNLKSEVLRLGINERSYIHSIGRMQNSIMQNENLFFVSTLNLDELDIRLFSNGEVQVVKQQEKPKLHDSRLMKGNLSKTSQNSCSTVGSKPPRVSLVIVNSPKGTKALTAHERNLSRHIALLVKEVFSNASTVRWSPDTDTGSRYESLLRGNAWAQPRYRVSVIVSHETTTKGKVSLTAVANPSIGFREPGNKFDIAVDVELTEYGVPIEGLKETVSLIPTASVVNPNVATDYNEKSRANLEKLVSNLRVFIEDLNCHLEHSNSVVFRDGKLTLEAGIDAGYFEGDELLMLPKTSYLTKRGLLSAVDVLAIARIIKIDKNQSELEIREGDVQLENGVEFSVRPLLDLI